jgi:phage terminase small subunit
MDATLTRRQEAFLATLLSCPTILQAARTAGIAEVTARRWLKEPSFQEAYRTARRHVVQHAVARVQQATCTAVETLEAIMQDPEAPASARVSAAKAVLETAIKGIELEDLEARIAALELTFKGPG